MENIQQLKEEIKTLFNLLTYEDQVQIIEFIKKSYLERSRV
jgi:hypothetical protein